MAMFLRIYRVVSVVGMGTAGDGVSRAGGYCVRYTEPVPTTHRLQLCQWLIR